ETALSGGGRHSAAERDVRRDRVKLAELLDASGLELGLTERGDRDRDLLQRLLAPTSRDADRFHGTARRWALLRGNHDRQWQESNTYRLSHCSHLNLEHESPLHGRLSAPLYKWNMRVLAAPRHCVNFAPLRG